MTYLYLDTYPYIQIVLNLKNRFYLISETAVTLSILSFFMKKMTKNRSINQQTNIYDIKQKLYRIKFTKFYIIVYQLYRSNIYRIYKFDFTFTVFP